MDTELIQRLAREAGFRIVPQLPEKPDWVRIYTGSATGRCEEALARFAALVAEEAAQIAHDMEPNAGPEIASARRAKFKEPTQ